MKELKKNGLNPLRVKTTKTDSLEPKAIRVTKEIKVIRVVPKPGCKRCNSYSLFVDSAC